MKEKNPARESIARFKDKLMSALIFIVPIGIISFFVMLFSGGSSVIGIAAFFIWVFSIIALLIYIVSGIVMAVLPKKVTSNEYYEKIIDNQLADSYNKNEYEALMKQYYVDLEKYEKVKNSEEYKDYMTNKVLADIRWRRKIEEANEELALTPCGNRSLKETASRLLDIFHNNEEITSIKTAYMILQDEDAVKKEQNAAIVREKAYLEIVEKEKAQEKRRKEEEKERKRQLREKQQAEYRAKMEKMQAEAAREAAQEDRQRRILEEQRRNEEKRMYADTGICLTCEYHSVVWQGCKINARPVYGQCVNRK